MTFMRNAAVTISFTLGLLVFSSWANASQNTAIAKVLISKGQVLAQSADGSRKLKRRAKIFQGDVIETGNGAAVQLRFVDGAMVSLSENTELKIESYAFDEANPKLDSSVLTLLKGGFKTITGNIGKRDPSRYSLKTGGATIGIRGTAFWVRAGSNVAVGVWKGGISVSNDQGVLNLGDGAQFNFAVVNPGQAPEARLTAPEKPPEDIKGEVKEGEQSSQGDEQAGDEAEQQIDDTSVAQVEEGEPLPLPESGATDPNAAPVDATQTNLDVADGNTDTAATGSSGTSTAVDQRLSATELASLDRLGLVAIGATGFVGISGGKASADSQTPIIVDYGVGPHEPGFGTVVPDVVYKAGDATLGTWAAESSYAGAPLTSAQLQWGYWGQPGTAYAFKDPNSTTGDALDVPVFWMTGVATDPTVVAGLTGSFIYSEVYSYRGGGTTGNVNYVSFTTNVDFSTATATSGNLYVLTDTATWNANFSSAPIVGQTIDVGPDLTGTVDISGSIDPATANLGLVFVGDSAQGLMGAFDFENQVDSTIHTEGVFAVGRQ